MEPEPNRTAERPTGRAILTEFDAGFNHPITDRGGRNELAATLADDVQWTVVADADGEWSARSYTDIDAVVEHVAEPPPRIGSAPAGAPGTVRRGRRRSTSRSFTPTNSRTARSDGVEQRSTPRTTARIRPLTARL